MGYDEEILNCVKNSFKTVKQISEETGINQGRLSVKLPMLEKFGLVFSMQGQSSKAGVKPRMFKKK